MGKGKGAVKLHNKTEARFKCRACGKDNCKATTIIYRKLNSNGCNKITIKNCEKEKFYERLKDGKL